MWAAGVAGSSLRAGGGRAGILRVRAEQWLSTSVPYGTVVSKVNTCLSHMNKYHCSVFLRSSTVTPTEPDDYSCYEPKSLGSLKIRTHNSIPS